MPNQFGYERGAYPAWMLSGVGFDKLTLNTLPLPEIGPDQVLARREVCTICFSSVKEILSGSKHPRLSHIDMERDPIILGDEAYIVLEKVGENLRDRFVEGAGYSVMPDMGPHAFGYDVPGGLCRYGIMEGPVLGYLIPVDMDGVERVGMFGVSLSEPVACIGKSLTLQYRSAPKEDGVMLIVSDGNDTARLELADRFNKGKPRKIVVAKAGKALRADIEEATRDSGIKLVFTDQNVPDARTKQFSPEGWNDLVVVTHDVELQREWVREGLTTLAKGGVMALVGDPQPGTQIEVELGTYHYDDTLLVGATSSDLSSAYTKNTDFGLRAGGTTAIVGAGGPMGQIALMWAMALGEAAPGRLLAIDTVDERLGHLAPLAQFAPENCRLECINAMKQAPESYLDGREIDYLLMMAPVPSAIETFLPFMAENAVINLFAGLRDQYAHIDAYDICARGLRLVGHSGDDMTSQCASLDKLLDGTMSVDPIVAAVGGADAAWDALWATHMGTYPGKIAIYMGCRHPLTPVAELTGGGHWNARYEREFIAQHRWKERI